MENSELVRQIYSKFKNDDFTRLKIFEKGETIANFIVNRNYIYFVLNGSAALIKNTKYGTEELIEIFDRFDFFGDNFYHVVTNNEMSVVARKRCNIFYFDFAIIKGKIEYFEMLHNIYELLNNKVKALNAHNLVMGEKTIRNKILTYFEFVARDIGSKNIELDINYTELASYLNVNRSALMREIKNLEDDKLIYKDRNFIKILY